MRLLLILLSILALAIAILGGLVRAGSGAVPVIPLAVIYHGPLAVSVFFGSLIGIERAVALERFWPWTSPVLSLASGVFLLQGSPLYHPFAFAAAAVFSAAGIAGYRRAPQFPLLVMAGGSLFWLLGNAMAYFSGAPAAVPSWAAFLTITIAGERLEFSKLRRSSHREGVLFSAALGLVALAPVLGTSFPAAAHLILGLGFLSAGLWLHFFDIARQSIKRSGCAKFIGFTLRHGYTWLAAAGAIMIFTQPVQSGFGYDAWLHSFFIGFVISMVFGHGPVIFPALIRRPFSYKPVLYLPVALLNGSLALRVAGDFVQSSALRLWGGWGNALAIASFFAVIIYCVLSGSHEDRPGARGSPLGNNA